MFIKRYLHDIAIAVEAIFANRLKSILTALGIIFGVAAVISMLAIGKGAEQEILEQIKLVGVNNIVITPSTFAVNENSSSKDDSGNDKPSSKKISKGLTLLDVEAIKKRFFEQRRKFHRLFPSTILLCSMEKVKSVV